MSDPYNLSAGEYIGTPQREDRDKMLAKYAMQYLNIDPTDPSKGRLAVRGTGGAQLTPDQEQYARDNYAKQWAGQAPAMPKGSVTMNGQTVTLNDLHKPIAPKPFQTLDFNELTAKIAQKKIDDEQHRKEALVLGEEEKKRQHDLALASVPVKGALDLEDKRHGFKVADTASDREYQKPEYDARVGQLTTQAALEKLKLAEEQAAHEKNLQDINDRLPAREQARQNTMATLVPALMQKDPALAKSILSKLDAFSGFADEAATALRPQVAPEDALTQHPLLAQEMKRLVFDINNTAKGMYSEEERNAIGQRVAALGKRFMDSGVKPDDAQAYIANALEVGVKPAGFMSHPISATIDTLLPGTPLEDLTGQGSMRDFLKLTPRGF